MRASQHRSALSEHVYAVRRLVRQHRRILRTSDRWLELPEKVQQQSAATAPAEISLRKTPYDPLTCACDLHRPLYLQLVSPDCRRCRCRGAWPSPAGRSRAGPGRPMASTSTLRAGRRSPPRRVSATRSSRRAWGVGWWAGRRPLTRHPTAAPRPHVRREAPGKRQFLRNAASAAWSLAPTRSRFVVAESPEIWPTQPGSIRFRAALAARARGTAWAEERTASGQETMFCALPRPIFALPLRSCSLALKMRFPIECVQKRIFCGKSSRLAHRSQLPGPACFVSIRDRP